MNRKLQERFRARVRKLVENILDEETPMPPPADDFKTKTPDEPRHVKVGNFALKFNKTDVEIFSIKKKAAIVVDNDSAVKIANMLYRVLGKV
jgi:wyosine [tRNA(Phe)-imidazoG37] synthetase (radical SAM superfamily)